MAYEAVDYQTITVERRAHVAILTLNRPERLNAINRDVMAEVPAAVAALKADDEVRALVVTGAGRGFCAGFDLMGAGQRIFPALRAGAQEPVRTDRRDGLGPALGDDVVGFRQAGDRRDQWGGEPGPACRRRWPATCALARNTRGSRRPISERSLSPDSGSMSFFPPRIVGHAAAADLIFTSRAVGFEEAKTLGLLNRIVPAAELSGRCCGLRQ